MLGPAEKWADVDGGSALLDHLVRPVLCVIGIDGIVAQAVEVILVCDASAMEGNSRATTLAVVD